MSEMELKPCPFCQSAARIIKKIGVTGTATKSRYYREHIVCKNKRCESRTKDFKRPGLAAKAWNTRPADAMEAILHEAGKMFATLADQMPEHAEDRHEIEEFQLRLAAALNREA